MHAVALQCAVPIAYETIRLVFLASSHFISSCPSLAQLLGVWCMLAWEQMGRPAAVRLVELGPGRGTLMADLMRVREGEGGGAEGGRGGGEAGTRPR